MNGIQKVSGSIPLISTTYLIHHICPMWFFLFIPLTAISDSLDSMRHFVPLKSVPYLTGSIPLISTTYLIHHICPMWFFLFIPLTAISDSLDSMRHFVPLKSVPYLTGSIPLISTTYLIHHICLMWFFLFIPLAAIRFTRFHASFHSFGIGSLLCRCLISLFQRHVPISPLHRHK